MTRAGGRDAAFSFVTREAGWHTAVVTSLAGVGRGEYRVWLSLDTAPPGPEASVLVPGVPTYATLVEGHGGPAVEAGVPFTFQGAEGDIVSIEMESDYFDTVLRLLDPSGAEIAYNDDAGDSFGSQIVMRLPSSGEYTVVATRWYWGAGDFMLLLEFLPELYLAEGELAEADADASGDIYHDYAWQARGRLGRCLADGRFRRLPRSLRPVGGAHRVG